MLVFTSIAITLVSVTTLDSTEGHATTTSDLICACVAGLADLNQCDQLKSFFVKKIKCFKSYLFLRFSICIML